MKRTYILLGILIWSCAMISIVNSAPPELQEPYDRALKRLSPNTPVVLRVKQTGRVDKVFRGCVFTQAEYIYVDFKCESYDR